MDENDNGVKAEIQKIIDGALATVVTGNLDDDGTPMLLIALPSMAVHTEGKAALIMMRGDFILRFGDAMEDRIAKIKAQYIDYQTKAAETKEEENV